MDKDKSTLLIMAAALTRSPSSGKISERFLPEEARAGHPLDGAELADKLDR